MNKESYENLISIIHKTMNHGQIQREEVRCAFNYVWNRWPQGRDLSKLRLITTLINDTGSLLSVPALIMALGGNITAEVLCGLYDSFRDHGVFVEEDIMPVIPMVVSGIGAGGKEIKTINVSTASAIVAASCGGMMLRIGTHAFWGASGASDFLLYHNIPMVADPDIVNPLLSATGLVFIDGDMLYPNGSRIIHPLVRAKPNVGMLLRELSYPIRNVVALSRPGGSEYAFRGVTLPVTYEVAKALRDYRGFKRGLVVYGSDKDGRRFDEISNVGPTEITEFNADNIKTFTLWPDDVGLPLRKNEDIEVQDIKFGYQVALEVLQGKRRKGDPIAELIALNAAGMLYAGGFISTIAQAVEKALDSISEGVPYALVERYRRTYAELSGSHIANHIYVGATHK